MIASSQLSNFQNYFQLWQLGNFQFDSYWFLARNTEIKKNFHNKFLKRTTRAYQLYGSCDQKLHRYSGIAILLYVGMFPFFTVNNNQFEPCQSSESSNSIGIPFNLVPEVNWNKRSIVFIIHCLVHIHYPRWHLSLLDFVRLQIQL